MHSGVISTYRLPAPSSQPPSPNSPANLTTQLSPVQTSSNNVGRMNDSTLACFCCLFFRLLLALLGRFLCRLLCRLLLALLGRLEQGLVMLVTPSRRAEVDTFFPAGEGSFRTRTPLELIPLWDYPLHLSELFHSGFCYIPQIFTKILFRNSMQENV